MFLKDFMLEDGGIINCKQLGLDPYTELKYEKDVARIPGTGYVDTHYRIVGTNDVLIEHQNMGEPGPLYSTVEVIKDYYELKKNYGYECGILSNLYDLPWEVCSAIGLNENLYPEFIERISNLYYDHIDNPIDLSKDMDQQKIMLQEVFGTEFYEALNVEKMGPKHIMTLTQYIYDEFERSRH